MPDDKPSSHEQLPVPLELIQRRIYVIRGHKVMLDADLAELYEVPTKRLNEAVRRNIKRFPADFMFQLSDEEATALRSQIATLETGRGRHSKYAPLAFTEHGATMLSSVLNSDRAIEMGILVVRAFIELRALLATHKDLARKIEQMEAAQRRQAGTLRQHTIILEGLVKDIQRIKHPPITRAIGFLIPRRPKKK